MATGWVEGVVAALSMELLLMMMERGSGQDLALPSGLSALSGVGASVFQAGMGGENIWKAQMGQPKRSGKF